MFDINPRFGCAKSRSAAEKIASGTMIVRRDSNSKRSVAFTFKHLGKLEPINASHIQELVTCFSLLIGVANDEIEKMQKDRSGTTKGQENTAKIGVTVIGLAESGIIPSFAMKTACSDAGIAADWLCSSRRGKGELSFLEPHSHAPEHFLPKQLLAQQQRDQLWIVEDEITTGMTIENLLKCLSAVVELEKVRVFAILDARENADRTRFNEVCDRQGWSVSVESILSFDDTKLKGSANCCPTLWKPVADRHFVVGEAIAEALPLVLNGSIKGLQQITRSFWEVDGNCIHSRLPWKENYFVYNVSGLDSMFVLG